MGCFALSPAARSLGEGPDDSLRRSGSNQAVSYKSRQRKRAASTAEATATRQKRSFRKRLRDLGFETYDEYLRSPHWRAVRKAYWSGDQPKRCYCCGAAGKQLHHPDYACLGKETAANLVLVCDACHTELHRMVSEDRLPLSSAHKDLAARNEYLQGPEPRPQPSRKGKKRKSKDRRPAPVTPPPVPKKVKQVSAENDRLHRIQVRNRERQAAARVARQPGVELPCWGTGRSSSDSIRSSVSA